MTSRPATGPGRHGRRRLLGALFVCATASVLIACGVTLGSGSEGSEFFDNLNVTGDFHPGGRLTLDVTYSQTYPIGLNVICDLLQPGKPTPTSPPSPTLQPGPTPSPTPAQIPRPATTPVTRIAVILDTTVEPNENAPTVTIADKPFDSVTPIAGRLTRDFQAPDQPGSYTFRCITPKDENNKVQKMINIQPASG